uniref:CCHC-type domain-containing protein n=1 Tax=Tanacetum cinerariifolium TaxID=118510 RepID=A0A6L2JNG7_TANCI|nr:hypothetical protein [Tanacetum cinerariifolium]
MDSCWTCGNPLHSYKNCPEEIASRKERVPKTYDYQSQYDAYEYDTYHANYNIEMEDDTLYQGEYGAQYFHPSSYETPSFFNQPQRPTQEYYYQGQKQGITMLDFDDDEDEGEEQNEEFTLHSTNTMEWSAFGSCKDKEDADDHNNSFEDLISPIKEQDKESVPFKVGEEVISKEDGEFLALLLYKDKCSNLLEEEQYPNEVEAEVTHILNPPQLPRVVINQVGVNDLVFENDKEQDNVSLVKDEHHVVERCYENSFSKLTHIIVKQVHRKARVGVRNLSQFVFYGTKNFREVLNCDKFINFASKKPQEKQVRSASSRRKRKRKKYARVTHTGNVPSNHHDTIISDSEDQLVDDLLKQTTRSDHDYKEGLVPNLHPSTSFVPPLRTDWDLLFQPLFDELLTPPPSVDNPAPEVISPNGKVVALVPVVSTGSPSLTTIDQDAPSPSNSQTTPKTQTSVISNNVEEDNHDLDVAHMNNDPIIEKSKLDEDLQGKPVDATLYCGMIGSLMYLTSSRADLTYAVCLCVQYQTKPIEKHLNAVKQIFQYLKGTINMGIWYLKDTIGLPRSKSALPSRVLRLNILPYLAKVQLPYPATPFNIQEPCTLIIISITKEQQQALDDTLVPQEQRLRIGKCNYILSATFKPPEPTFQVALDVLSLTLFYQAFLITASVPAIYMHEFWATVSYHKYSIKFKMNKKNYSFDLETFRDML